MIDREQAQHETVLARSPLNEDGLRFENTLRPATLAEYIGQIEIKKNLGILIAAAKNRNEPIEHILLHGPPGLGKTTLASVITRETGGNLKTTAGPALERQGDLAAMLTNLKEGDVLFIDEIHRLRPPVQEVLYSAMEDFSIDMILGKGPSARSVSLAIPRFTLIGATTKVSMLSAPLRDRFGTIFKFSFYTEDDIYSIIMRSARILQCVIDDSGARMLARSCRQTPRVANRLLRRVRDYAEVHGHKTISTLVVEKTLDLLGIDAQGLDDMDRNILATIIKKFQGGPVGLNTISSAFSEEQATIEDVYEPYLIQVGFLERTARGRKVTPHAYRHLGIHEQKNQLTL